MGDTTDGGKINQITNLTWFIFIVWFCSNLLSQLAYIIAYGLPYDGISMLKSLGPIYYVAVIFEVLNILFFHFFSFLLGPSSQWGVREPQRVPNGVHTNRSGGLFRAAAPEDARIRFQSTLTTRAPATTAI